MPISAIVKDPGSCDIASYKKNTPLKKNSQLGSDYGVTCEAKTYVNILLLKETPKTRKSYMDGTSLEYWYNMLNNKEVGPGGI
jgi:hypothetical protein